MRESVVLSSSKQASPCGGGQGRHGGVSPQDLCEILTALQQDAPRHSYHQTRKQIQLCFGVPIEAIFESFEEVPLASASIAQVRSIHAPLPGHLINYSTLKHEKFL